MSGINERKPNFNNETSSKAFKQILSPILPLFQIVIHTSTNRIAKLTPHTPYFGLGFRLLLFVRNLSMLNLIRTTALL